VPNNIAVSPEFLFHTVRAGVWFTRFICALFNTKQQNHSYSQWFFAGRYIQELYYLINGDYLQKVLEAAKDK
jgi:hypothetical protein